MISFPDTEKKLKNRISNYRSALNKEKKEYDSINDRAGKRYSLFALYFVLNDLKKSEKYFEWYKEEFYHDVGEPIQKLCWALSLYRMDKIDDARYVLADLMLLNLYVIPRLLGQDIKKYDIWHSSSDAYYDYFDHIWDEVLEAISKDDRSWIKEQYDSFAFRRIRQRYIEIYGQLQNVEDLSSRKKLLEEAGSFLDVLKP